MAALAVKVCFKTTLAVSIKLLFLGCQCLCILEYLYREVDACELSAYVYMCVCVHTCMCISGRGCISI